MKEQKEQIKELNVILEKYVNKSNGLFEELLCACVEG